MPNVNGDDPERALARAAKKSGYSRDGYLITRRVGITRQAIAGGWNREAVQSALNDIEMLAAELWPTSPRRAR